VKTDFVLCLLTCRRMITEQPLNWTCIAYHIIVKYSLITIKPIYTIWMYMGIQPHSVSAQNLHEIMQITVSTSISNELEYLWIFTNIMVILWNITLILWTTELEISSSNWNKPEFYKLKLKWASNFTSSLYKISAAKEAPHYRKARGVSELLSTV
jgi:hypothetical protein